MAIIEKRSTLTAEGQTTVPEAVRHVLGVKGGDQIAFRIEGHRVTVVPVVAAHEDPVVGKFVSFLGNEIENHPETLKPLTENFVARIEALVKGAKVDQDTSIEGDVDL